MRTIHKFELKQTSNQIPLPKGAKLLHVGEQEDVVTLWVELDANAPRFNRIFHIVGTGWVLPEGLRHFGSVQMTRTGLVWHIYEGVSDE